MIRAILAVILIGLLTACGGKVPGLSDRLLQQAIALEVTQTQQVLTKELRLTKLPKVDVKNVAIAQQDALEIQGLPGYHLQGTYDLTLKLPQRQVTQAQNSFDLYLQHQPEEKTWNLARLAKTDAETAPQWVTQPLQS